MIQKTYRSNDQRQDGEGADKRSWGGGGSLACSETILMKVEKGRISRSHWKSKLEPIV